MKNSLLTYWVLVADSGSARIFELRKTPAEFREAHSLVSDALHKRSSDLVSDNSGRSFNTQGPAGHSKEQKSDPHELAEREFSRKLADKLELTETQRAEIKAVTEGTRPEAEKAREAVREAMKALHEATTGGIEAEIIAAGKAVGDTMTEQALLRAATMKQIKEILTNEQLVQFEELRAEMRERMQQRRKDGDGPRKRDGQRRRQKPDQD